MGGRNFPRREKKKPKKEEGQVARSPLTQAVPMVEVPVVKPKGKKREEEA